MAEARTIRQWCVVALLMACIAACLLLLWKPDLFEHEELANLQELDAIIEEELVEFNIRQNQIRQQQAGPTEGFQRRVYRVDVAPALSKTFFHAELAARLQPLGVSSPALVSFPERDLRIHVYWKGTVVRTIHLSSNPDLHRNENPGSVLFVFERQPDTEALTKIAQLGEPVRVILRSDNADVLLRWTQQWPRTMPPPLLDLDYGAGLAGLTEERFERYVSDIVRLRKQWPNTAVLVTETGGATSEGRIQRLLRTGAQVARIQKPTALRAEVAHAQFKDFLHEFVWQSRAGEHPILIIPADSDKIGWFKEDLVGYKKGGLHLVEPSFVL